MDLALTVEAVGPGAVLYCDGRIVCGPHIDLLVRRCGELLEVYPVIGLDMSGVTAVDSVGLGSLVRVLASARKRGKDLVIISPSERASQALRLAKLLAVFPHFNSVQEFYMPGTRAVIA